MANGIRVNGIAEHDTDDGSQPITYVVLNGSALFRRDETAQMASFIGQLLDNPDVLRVEVTKEEASESELAAGLEIPA